jgi:hypothetical protein
MVGRPTKYNKEMLKLANAYIDNHEEYGDPVPIAAGMAVELDVGKKTLYNWADEHPEFLHTLSRLQDKQEKMLAGGALTSEFNATIAKLMLHNHGYSDKAEIEQKQEISIIEVQKDFD